MVGKIHNQAKLENSVSRCDTLGANMIERKAEIIAQKMLALDKNKEAVMDYIFGKTNENPLEEFTSQINDDLTEYLDTCEQMTVEVLASTRE